MLFYIVGSLVNIMDNLSEENRIRFTLQLAEAMVWIHSNNIIHCDIKPDNVLLTSSNNLVLSDFGSAILLENVCSNFLNHPVFSHQIF